MAKFEPAFTRTHKIEGGYSNHPDDRGGATRYGITEAVARKWGYKGDMSHLPVSLAKKIAFNDYWKAVRGGSFNSQLIANEVYDTAFNSGPGTAVKLLQKAVNEFHECLNRNKIKVDGRIGPKTLGAVNVICQRYEVQFNRCLNGEQYRRFKWIKSIRPSQKSFFIGWMLRLA